MKLIKEEYQNIYNDEVKLKKINDFIISVFFPIEAHALLFFNLVDCASIGTCASNGTCACIGKNTVYEIQSPAVIVQLPGPLFFSPSFFLYKYRMVRPRDIPRSPTP